MEGFLAFLPYAHEGGHAEHHTRDRAEPRTVDPGVEGRSQGVTGTYTAKVDAWLAAAPRDEHGEAHPHGELPAIDAGMREWYKACRCCMHDAYPAVVEQLDAERAAMAQAPSDAGICETAEAQQPSSP